MYQCSVCNWSLDHCVNEQELQRTDNTGQEKNKKKYTCLNRKLNRHRVRPIQGLNLNIMSKRNLGDFFIDKYNQFYRNHVMVSRLGSKATPTTRQMLQHKQ